MIGTKKIYRILNDKELWEKDGPVCEKEGEISY